ncbi:tRNA-binding protein [Ferroacidibacillus organovorans]|uniref:tRNA-binding protein n=1 Tax=Ferroacidibacillus organovorans TaxID=1765683 RepID=UPI000A8D1383|nr:tRNA-binding protein [Ferroacidibacillus organovorans]
MAADDALERKEGTTYDSFSALDVRVGKILTANLHPKAKKPAYQLTIDFGALGVKKSSAQLTVQYQPEDLIGRLVVAVVNFPPRVIGGFTSEVLVLGAVHEDGAVTLLTPERAVPLGAPIA